MFIGVYPRFRKQAYWGYFCFAHIAIHERRRFRKDPEFVDVETEHLAFQRYAIPHMRFEEFRQTLPQVEDDEDAFYPWMLNQEEAFARLWERMTVEVEHLLFGNRGFLLEFNLELAEYRRRRGDLPSTRCAIPKWGKKAVYFRENGKCRPLQEGPVRPCCPRCKAALRPHRSAQITRGQRPMQHPIAVRKMQSPEGSVSSSHVLHL